MRDKPCDTPVSINERMYPQQAVMHGRAREDGLGLAQPCEYFFETLHEARHRSGAYTDVPADLYVSRA
jgi:hypothetical protein